MVVRALRICQLGVSALVSQSIGRFSRLSENLGKTHRAEASWAVRVDFKAVKEPLKMTVAPREPRGF